MGEIGTLVGADMPGHREIGATGSGSYDMGGYVQVTDMDFIISELSNAHQFPLGPIHRVQHVGLIGLAWAPASDFADAAVVWWKFIDFDVEDAYIPAGVFPVNFFFWQLEPGVVADIGASWT